MPLNLKAIIVEDKPRHASLLKRVIKAVDQDGIFDDIAIVQNYQDAVVAFSVKYNVSFLDIELGPGSCFDLPQDVDMENMGIIILTTGNDINPKQHEQLKPLRVLGKPYSKAATKEALSAIKEKLISKEGLSVLGNLIDSTLELKRAESVKQGRTYNFKTDNKNSKSIKTIRADDLYAIEGAQNYATVYYLNISKNVPDKFLTRIPLTELEEALDKNQFVRCHYSYIINKDIITEYIPGSSGGMLQTKIKFKGQNLSIPYSDSYKPILTQKGIIGNIIKKSEK